MTDFKDYTIFIRNFDSKLVTHDLLLELFTQAGPVQNLTLKEDFAFLEFEDKESVIYACNLLNDTELFGIPLQVKPRNGSCYENVELYKFPNKQNYNDTDNRSGNNINNNYNEYRQNSRSTNNSFNESSEYRQNNHRSSYHENDFSVNNNRSGNYYEDDYRQNIRSTNNRHQTSINFAADSDYNWQNGTNRFLLNNNYNNNNNNNNNRSQDNRPVDNQPFFTNNFEYRNQRSLMEIPSQNRGFNVTQERRQMSTESLWRDRGANSGPAINNSYGNYRSRPY